MGAKERNTNAKQDIATAIGKEDAVTHDIAQTAGQLLGKESKEGICVKAVISANFDPKFTAVSSCLS